MLNNRSIPHATVIPELPYADVNAGADWLCGAFGFTVRLRIGNHRAQLNVGAGAMVVVERPPGDRSRSSVMVRVEDASEHCERARSFGARIVREPADHPYGERQYTAEDCGGHVWKFSQSIADVAPEEWGGVSGEL